MPKRRRGYCPPPGSRRPRPPRHDRFEWLVERALARIPPPFSDVLDEVAIVIADDLTDEQRREQELGPDEVLYGLYDGVPRTEWGADSAAMPNRITLYRLPLEEDFPDPFDLEEEVRETVIHELAHHLGIDDERLSELGHA